MKEFMNDFGITLGDHLTMAASANMKVEASNINIKVQNSGFLVSGWPLYSEKSHWTWPKFDLE